MACLGLTVISVAMLSACSSDDDSTGDSSTTVSATSTQVLSQLVPAQQPTVDELNGYIGTLLDMNTSASDKAKFLQDGDQATELLNRLQTKAQDSGISFSVVDPISAGYTGDSVLVTVQYTLKDRPARTIDNVELIYADKQWKLTRNWACTFAGTALGQEYTTSFCGVEDKPMPTSDSPAPTDGDDGETSTAAAPTS